MADTTMRAVIFEKFGLPDVLKVEDVPVPSRKPDEVLVKVYAAGVNPIDYLIRKGEFLKPLAAIPQTPGFDLAGVVEDSSEASEFKKGQRVFAMVDSGKSWLKQGTYAEYYAVKEAYLVEPPVTLSFEEAAGVPLAAMTAYQALEAAGVKAGQRVLIHAGAGGVGSLAIQIAKARGAHVITTAGPRNADFVTKELGADEVIDYTSQKVEEVLKDNPVDVVIDSQAGAVEKASFKVLKRRGHYQLILNQNVSPLRIIAGLFKGLLRLGPSYGMTACKPNGKQLQHIADLIAAGKVKPILDRTYPLEEAAEAHTYLEKGHARGKVVLRVRAAS